MTRIAATKTAAIKKIAARYLGVLGLGVLACASPAYAGPAQADEARPAAERFSKADVAETPDFQRHVVPLMGKLGCNGRACHGSFQGQGGFRLSLFGYDFKMDHEQLTQADEENEKDARVDLEFSEDSLMLLKPTLEMPHKGGKRMEVGSWQHRLILNWIEAGAKPVQKDAARFVRLDVTPKEIIFHSEKEQQQLKVVAVWSDGTREDVTCLCRFQTNDDAIAQITDDGLVAAAGDRGDTHVVVFYDTGVVPIPVLRPVSKFVGDKYPSVAGFNNVDDLVQQKLAKLGLIPSDLADDAEFLRRVSLDVTGSLPAPQEVSAFLSDTSSDKRARKIDELLERPSYAAWWTTRLCDMTSNNDYELRNAVPNRTASQSWYDWIYKRVADNTPYDKLAEGIILATSRRDDESFAEFNEAMHAIHGRKGEASYADRPSMPFYWARNNFRANERAIGFAYTFMGMRIECAQCHKHPFDQWTQDDFTQFMGFFDRNRIAYGQNPKNRDEARAMIEELGVADEKGNQLRNALGKLEAKGKVIPYDELYVSPSRGNARKGGKGGGSSPQTAKLLGGDVVDLTKVQDTREPLMDWLRNSESRMFARAFVNRVWSNYFNRGIVEPTDDLSLANPPTNAALLEYLTKGFVTSGYDMKWLHREITNSRTYQTSWVPNESNALDERNFSHAIPRRMPAEVAYDAIAQATACDAEIVKLQQDVSDRAIALAGSSPQYGNRGNNYALTVFGRSIRESNCDCDRSSEPSLLQTVFLQNDDEVFELLNRGDGGWLDELFGIGENKQNDARDRLARAADAKRVAAVKARLKKARQEKDQDELQRLEKRIAQWKAEREREQESAEEKQTTRTELSPEEVVRQAYLRSVSRYPTDEELSRATSYVASAENQVEGVRGLLWALLNTKEFIVNH